MEVDMSIQAINIAKLQNVEEVKKVEKVEFSIERVIIWSLIFTNAYFLSFLLAKLF